VLLVLRHDPAVGQVWTLVEVCAACAARMTHTRVVGRPLPRTRPPREETVVPLEAPATTSARSVPAGFSAPAPEAGVASRPGAVDGRRRR
jgi:hypothetical protein